MLCGHSDYLLSEQAIFAVWRAEMRAPSGSRHGDFGLACSSARRVNPVVAKERGAMVATACAPWVAELILRLKLGRRALTLPRHERAAPAETRGVITGLPPRTTKTIIVSR